MAIKFWSCGIFEKTKVKREVAAKMTITLIWQILCWSFEAGFNGTFPSSDWQDKCFADGPGESLLAGDHLCSDEEPFFAVIWSIKGDLDWFAKGLGLRAHNAVEPCEWCPVSTHAGPEMWPTYFGVDAPWKNRITTALQWRLDKGERMHLLFKKLYYLTCMNVEADELHVLHLGISQYFLGSVLHLLVYTIMSGTPTENMDAVWDALVIEYKKFPNRTQFSSISLSSFVTVKKAATEYPRLKGRGCEVKNLVAPLLSVFPQFARRRDAHDAKVVEALSALLRVQDTLDEYKGDCFLPCAVALQFRVDMDIFLSAYTHLGVQADARSSLLFSAVPKLHWAWHLAHRAMYLNPRRAACFIDEDFVKHMKTLGTRCTASTPLHKVVPAMMVKYTYGVGLEAS